VTNEVVRLLRNGVFSGMEFHIPVNPEKRTICCEGRDLAVALSSALDVHCSIKTSLGCEQKPRKPFTTKRQAAIFPVHMPNLGHKNFLEISISDPIIAAGFAAVLMDPRIHSSVKIFPINDTRRPTGGKRRKKNR
jgi:hypothetical protein